jgi:hypothetical protein
VPRVPRAVHWHNELVRSSRILAEIRDLRAEARIRDERANHLAAETNELMTKLTSEVALNRGVIRRNERVKSELVDAVREIKDEVSAQTQAIFKLINRLDGGTAPA